MFFHISSALALFMGMAIAWVGITKLQHAVDKTQIDDSVKFLSSLKSIFMSAGILLLITGIYMVEAKWSWTAWIIVSMLIWLFLVLHSSFVTGKKIREVRKLLSSNAEKTSEELHQYINKLRMLNSLQSELAVGVGAIFIMTVKPDVVGSVCVVIVAIILGILPRLSKRNPAVSG